MTKYYRVYLNEYLIGNGIHIDKKHPVICQRSLFAETYYSEYVFVEIITGKVIYPSTMEYRKELTYELSTGYQNVRPRPHCEEISSTEVKEWLSKMDKESTKKYIDDICRLEQKAINTYKKNKEDKTEEIKQENQQTKLLKKTLKQIKKR